MDKVKDYINSNLYPKTRNIIDPTKENFQQPESINEVLDSLDINEEEYYQALSISSSEDFEIHLRRPTDSCFVNNYFPEGLKAWEANMDLQPVFNHYKAVTYMCKYLSKAEDECSNAMKQAFQEAREMNCSKYEEMVKIAKAYASKRECSVQEAVYHVMPELWLRKTFPKVQFMNTNLPEQRFRMAKSEEELSELPEDSTDVFKRNMLDRYMNRPDSAFKGGRFAVVDRMCFAFFQMYYYIDSRDDNEFENDNLPVVLTNQLLEENETTRYPSSIPIMNSKERLKCRKVPLVLRFAPQNKHCFPEKFAHHLLMCYLPFRSEDELKMNTYTEKLYQPGILDIINENKMIVMPYGDLVDDALQHFILDGVTSNLDPFAQQENDEVQDNLPESQDQEDSETEEENCANYHGSATQCVVSDGELFQKIRALNTKQREIFDVVFSWAKTFVKNQNTLEVKHLEPLNIFLTGEGGCGKSHLIKVMYNALQKILIHKGGEPDKYRVLLLARQELLQLILVEPLYIQDWVFMVIDSAYL